VADSYYLIHTVGDFAQEHSSTGEQMISLAILTSHLAPMRRMGAEKQKH
jgi:hypothetical protein